MKYWHILISAGILAAGCQSSQDQEKTSQGPSETPPEAQVEPLLHSPSPSVAPTSSHKKESQHTTLIEAQAMTIPYKITLGGKLSPEQRQQAEAIIDQTFAEVDSLYNRWNPQSELSKLNQLPAGEKVHLSLPLERFLLQVDQIVEMTEGRFDPTMLPLQLLWERHLELGAVPPQWNIKELEPVVGWDKVHVSQGLFWKDHDSTALDLGGVAKGYAVDLLTERLKTGGFADALIEWGGEVRTSGKHPTDRPWRVFISRLGNPDPQSAVDTLELRDMALATSGDYMQFWHVQGDEAEEEKRAFFHIVNPKTLKALEIRKDSIASVSVLAPNCMLADAMATAAMMFEETQEAKRWAQAMQARLHGTAFWIVSRGEKSSSQEPQKGI